MFRRILPGILTALTLLLDVTVLPMFVSSDLMPSLSLMSVLCIGLLLGRTRGLTHGLIAGLALDILVATPMGLQTILYTLIGYTGGIFCRTFTRHPLTPLLAAAVCFTVYEAVCYLYVVFSTFAFYVTLLPDMLLVLVIHIVAAQAMYYLYDFLIKPSRSRFAPR